METRVLKYFLEVAKRNNITQAAESLHITQPTLSRQIIELERELGVKLFDREKRQMRLNKAGAVFQQRAATILAILDQTTSELVHTKDQLSGTINLGIVESAVANFMMTAVSDFQARYPDVRFNIFDGDGDTLCRRLDQGLCDLIALIQPIEATKYNYFELPVCEQWGLIMRADDRLAKRRSITAQDLPQLPLIIGRRSLVRDDLVDDFHLDPTKLDWKVKINLPENGRHLLLTGKYYHLGIKGVYDQYHDQRLTFVPFSPKHATGHLLAWRKNLQLTPAVEKFIQFVAERSVD
ncbi:LysR family transcriptional regulator [uncultured Limosilactobacillus sp.]|uniref:LysR family transcriptional regulator n=1 Tax=uncultured Limosilactobacillus sp. TaxID=2837629 RepID=UPI0025FA292A|nr:LysR family transcriptional regulator [uncultured Limosilactobacillus sp.]